MWTSTPIPPRGRRHRPRERRPRRPPADIATPRARSHARRRAAPLPPLRRRLPPARLRWNRATHPSPPPTAVPSPRGKLVERGDHVGALRGGRDHHLGIRGERHEPHLELGRKAIEEHTRRLLGRLQPVRHDVGPAHRFGPVDREDDGSRDLRLLQDAELREADGDEDDGAGHQDGGDALGPPGLGDPRERGTPSGRLLAPADQDGDDEHQKKHQGDHGEGRVEHGQTVDDEGGPGRHFGGGPRTGPGLRPGEPGMRMGRSCGGGGS